MRKFGWTTLYRCEGTECGDNASDERYDGVCDKDGCDFANYRLGDQVSTGCSISSHFAGLEWVDFDLGTCQVRYLPDSSSADMGFWLEKAEQLGKRVEYPKSNSTQPKSMS